MALTKLVFATPPRVADVGYLLPGLTKGFLNFGVKALQAIEEVGDLSFLPFQGLDKLTRMEKGPLPRTRMVEVETCLLQSFHKLGEEAV
jgi:hypothetical protein